MRINSVRRLLKSNVVVPDVDFLAKAKKYSAYGIDELRTQYKLGKFICRSKSIDSHIVNVYQGTSAYEKELAIFEYQKYSLAAKTKDINCITFNFIKLSNQQLGPEILATLLTECKLAQIQFQAILADYTITTSSFNAFTALLSVALKQGNKACLYSDRLDKCVVITEPGQWIKSCKKFPKELKEDLRLVVFRKGFNTNEIDAISLDDYISIIYTLIKIKAGGKTSGPSGSARLFDASIPNEKLNPKDWLVLSDNNEKLCTPGKIAKPEQDSPSAYPCLFSAELSNYIFDAFTKRRYKLTDATQEQIEILADFKIPINKPKAIKIASAARFSKNIAVTMLFYIALLDDQTICVIRIPLISNVQRQ